MVFFQLPLTLGGRPQANDQALADVDEVRLRSGRCSECRLKAGKALLENAMRSSSVMLEGLGVSDFTVHVEAMDRRASRPLRRREFFSLLADGKARKGLAGSLSTGTKGPILKSEGKDRGLRSRECAPASRRMQFLRELLERPALAVRSCDPGCSSFVGWRGVEAERC